MTRRRSHRRCLPWAFVCCLAFFLPHHAHAQTAQETALARSLFSEGVTLADKADWKGAADRFGRAYALKPTSGIAFNFASALIELRRYVEASELLRTVTRDGQASEDLRRQAEEKLRLIEPRIAYLSVHLEGEPGGTARIDVDDQEWPRAAWGVASPLDPGPHKVRCVVDGQERAVEDIELADGQREEVTLKLGAGTAVTLPKVEDPDSLEKPPPPLDAETQGGRKPLYKNWMLWTGVGVAIAGGVVAAVLLAGKRGTTTTGEVEGNTGGGIVTWPPSN